MKKKALFLRLLLRDIRQNLGRYFAILLIIALGVGFFSGLRISKTQMISTGDRYLSEHQMYDFMIASTLGLDKEAVEILRADALVRAAEGSVSADVLVTEADGSDQALKAMQLTDTVNLPDLVAGRLPQAADECVVDNKLYSEEAVGQTVTISEVNDEDTQSLFAVKEYTIVGIVRSVSYISFQRGSTSLGNGKLSGFFYLTPDGFNSDYYTEIYLTVSADGAIYSDAYNDAIAEIAPQIKTLADAAAQNRYQKLISDANTQIAEVRSEYNQALADFQTAKQDTEKTLADTLAELVAANETLTAQEEALAEQERQLKEVWDAGLMDQSAYTAALAQISEAKALLDEKRQEWQSGYDAYESGKEEAEEAFAETEAELADALRKIEQAEADRDAIQPPEVYTLNRGESNVGYATFENDTSIVEGISTVFPVFFFLVAALVCMTTMTRLVKEQRTQIGVWKALGYGGGRIMGKYMLYAGSAAVIGCTVGFCAGTLIFPHVIWGAYNIMYGFAPLDYVMSWPLAILSLLVSLICSVGTVWLVCRRELSQMPAEAIRPKAPKAGKRIFLERIPFLWKRMSFLLKVSVRNVFRYKKRFFMMLLGIGGCTALLVTGFGIRDSIQGVVDQQFDEISIYDAEIGFLKVPTENEQVEFLKTYEEQLEGALFVHKSSITMVFGDRVKDTNMIVTDQTDIADFWRLCDNGKSLSLPGTGEAVINRKLSEQFGLSVGDVLTLRNDELREITVKIAGIFDNYIDSYVFLSVETYQEGWGQAPEFSTAFVNFKQASDIHMAAAVIAADENISRVTISQDTMESLDQSLESLNYIVLVVIFSAAMLAFIVLFNLTNINITERIREIATIKVLGFYPMESAAYVFRESFILTAISALIGLLLGKGLHAFVMNEIDIDMLRFNVRVEWLSYGGAFLLTLLFAAAVNLAIYGALEKIDMAQSLKSVE